MARQKVEIEHECLPSKLQIVVQNNVKWEWVPAQSAHSLDAAAKKELDSFSNLPYEICWPIYMSGEGRP